MYFLFNIKNGDLTILFKPRWDKIRIDINYTNSYTIFNIRGITYGKYKNSDIN